MANDVDKFKRAVTLLEQGFDVPTAAFLVRLSPAMVEQFQRLDARCRPARHRQQEVRHAFKKITQRRAGSAQEAVMNRAPQPVKHYASARRRFLQPTIQSFLQTQCPKVFGPCWPSA